MAGAWTSSPGFRAELVAGLVEARRPAVAGMGRGQRRDGRGRGRGREGGRGRAATGLLGALVVAWSARFRAEAFSTQQVLDPYARTPNATFDAFGILSLDLCADVAITTDILAPHPSFPDDASGLVLPYRLGAMGYENGESLSESAGSVAPGDGFGEAAVLSCVSGAAGRIAASNQDGVVRSFSYVDSPGGGGGFWSQDATELTADGVIEPEEFGASLAIHEFELYVGFARQLSGGSVFLYNFNGLTNAFELNREFPMPDGFTNISSLGASLAVDSSRGLGPPPTVVSGAPFYDTNRGMAVVWLQSEVGFPVSLPFPGDSSDPAEDDEFGFSVAADGNYVAIGAPGKGILEGTAGTAGGAIYICSVDLDSFVAVSEQSLQQAGYFNHGFAVAMYGPLLVSSGLDLNGGTFPGVALIYELVGSTWTFSAAANPAPALSLSSVLSVAVFEDSILVGGFADALGAVALLESTPTTAPSASSSGGDGSVAPSSAPSEAASALPTSQPTSQPTPVAGESGAPSAAPSEAASALPTSQPTPITSTAPTASMSPSEAPTPPPSEAPTGAPTSQFGDRADEEVSVVFVSMNFTFPAAVYENSTLTDLYRDGINDAICLVSGLVPDEVNCIASVSGTLLRTTGRRLQYVGTLAMTLDAAIRGPAEAEANITAATDAVIDQLSAEARESQRSGEDSNFLAGVLDFVLSAIEATPENSIDGFTESDALAGPYELELVKIVASLAFDRVDGTLLPDVFRELYNDRIEVAGALRIAYPAFLIGASFELETVFKTGLDAALCMYSRLTLRPEECMSFVTSSFEPEIVGGSRRRRRLQDDPSFVTYNYSLDVTLAELSGTAAVYVSINATPSSTGDFIEGALRATFSNTSSVNSAFADYLEIAAHVTRDEMLRTEAEAVDGITTFDVDDATTTAIEGNSTQMTAAFASVEEASDAPSMAPSGAPSAAPTAAIDPGVLEARMSNDLTEVTVRFADATTQYPSNANVSAFACEAIFEGAAFRNETCRWLSAETVQLLLNGAASVLAPGDSIEVRRGTPLACVSDCSMPSIEGVPNLVVLEAPLEPVVPDALLAYHSVVTPCADNLTSVDALATRGGGGRPFAFAWSVLSNEEMLPPRFLDAVANANETLFYFIEDLEELDEDLIFSDFGFPDFVQATDLRLSLSITNFVGAASTTPEIRIRRVSNASFVTRIDGFQRQSLRLDRATSFLGTIIPPCAADADLFNISGNWRVQDLDGNTVPVTDASTVDSIFLLPPYSGLRANETFNMVFQALRFRDSVEAEVRVQAVVDILPLVPRFSGCNTTISPLASSSATHVINGSLSYDKNVGPFADGVARAAVRVVRAFAEAEGGVPLTPSGQPTASAAPSELPIPSAIPSRQPTTSAAPSRKTANSTDRRRATREEAEHLSGADPWARLLTVEDPTTTCELALNSSLANAAAEDKALVLDASALAGCTVTIGFLLESPDGVAAAVNSTCSLEVVGGFAPEIAIITEFANKVSATNRVAIRGEVTPGALPIIARWTLADGGLAAGRELVDVATTALNKSIAAITNGSSSTPIPFNLVVPPGALDERLTYAFELVAEFEETVKMDGRTLAPVPSSARISFVVNAAPTSGVFVVAPPNGTFETLYNLEATGWVDEDLPLAFQFRAEPSNRTEIYLLNPTRTASNRIDDTLLPAGVVIAGSVVVLRATILDVLGAAATRDAVAVVTPPASPDVALEAAGNLLGDLESRGFGDSSIDEVYATLGAVAGILTGLEDDAEGEAAARELQRQGLGLLSEAVTAHFVSEELLDSQATSLQGLSSSGANTSDPETIQNATAAILDEVAASVLRVASQLLGNAENATTVTVGEDAEEGGSAIGLGPAEALTRALSNILELGGNVTSNGTVPLDIQDAAQQLQRIRAASLLANEAPEVLIAARLISIFSVQTLDDTEGFSLSAEPPDTSSPELRAVLELSRDLLRSFGVGILENFLFGLVTVDAGAFSSAAEEESGGEAEGSQESRRTLVSGVQRLGLTLEPTSVAQVPRVSESFTDALSGTFNFTQALSLDTFERHVAECKALGLDAPSEEEDDAGSGDACLRTFPCTAFNPDTGAFQVLEECDSELLPPDATAPFGSVVCRCEFTEALARRLQSSAGNDDDSTVSLDFGTLMVTAGSTFKNFNSFGKPQLLVLLVAIFMALFFAIFAYFAHRLDEEDAHVDELRAQKARSTVRAWMERCNFSDKLMQKLLTEEAPVDAGACDECRHDCVQCLGALSCCALCGEAKRRRQARKMKITSMEDVRLLKRQSWSEVLDFCAEHELAEQEAALLRSALATAGREDLRLSKDASGAIVVVKEEDAVAPAAVDATKLDAELNEAPRLDIYFWYGLLLATPHRLLNYKERTLKEYLWENIKTRHDAFDALSLHEGNAPTRFVRVLYFATSTFAALFVTAVIYQVIYPDDDDYCNSQNVGEAVCEADASQLNAKENRCFFNAATRECRPTEPDPSTVGVIIAAGFALIFMAPLAVYFRWHVNEFLSEPPPREVDLLSERKHRRKLALKRSERKRAAQLARSELDLLRCRRRLQPWYFRYMVPSGLAERFMALRVHVAARQAAKIETDLDAERSTWPMHDVASFSEDDYKDLVHEVMERKILVTKVAVRDSLPWLKSLVFRSYTTFTLITEVPSQRTRYAAIGAMILFDLFCLVYLLAFGANITFDQSVGWFVSFVLGEIVVVTLLIMLRITILNVVMPALVRPDVTVERAVFNMPHYSAAGIFARQRPDLVPGLAAVFDARWHGLREQEDSATGPRDPAPRTRVDDGSPRQSASARLFQIQDANERERRTTASGTLLNLVHKLARHESEMNRDENASPVPPPSMTTTPVPGGARDSTGEGRGSESAFGRAAARVTAQVKKDRLREMDYLTVRGITGAYSANTSAGLSGQFATSGSIDASASGSRLGYTSGGPSVRGSNAKTQQSLSVDSTALDYTQGFSTDYRVNSSMSVPEDDEEDYDSPRSGEAKRSSLNMGSPTRSFRSKFLKKQGSTAKSFKQMYNTDLSTVESQESSRPDVHILDASKTLRRRNPLLKWATRLLLVVFALVLIWPEPVQEFLLEEGIPVGLTLMLLVGLQVDVDEGIEVLISFLIIVLVAAFGLLVVYFVSTEILKNLGAFKELWSPDDDGAFQEKTQLAKRAGAEDQKGHEEKERGTRL